VKKKHIILISNEMDQTGTDILKQKCEVLIAESEKDFQIKARFADAIILIRSGDAFKNTIERAQSLKVIAKHGVGLDKIDLQEAKKREIPVIYTPDSNSISVAEHFITLALTLAKQMNKANLKLRHGEWKHNPFDFLGIELFEKTIGILGFGRIGREVARICHFGFNMKVLYYDEFHYIDNEVLYNANKVNLEELFKKSDFVSINLPLTKDTNGIVNSKYFKLMKPSSYIINVARGPIWDENDLFLALKERWIRGAATDVFAREPTDKNNPLLELDNFIGTPHVAAHTEESMRNASVMLANDILAIFEGSTPKYPVPSNLY
jgi:D-3-phosphoglycerate dehydrogenase